MAKDAAETSRLETLVRIGRNTRGLDRETSAGRIKSDALGPTLFWLLRRRASLNGCVVGDNPAEPPNSIQRLPCCGIFPQVRKSYSRTRNDLETGEPCRANDDSFAHGSRHLTLTSGGFAHAFKQTVSSLAMAASERH